MFLPQPHTIKTAGGAFRLSPGAGLFVPPHLERPEQLAVQEIADLCAQRCGVRPDVRSTAPTRQVPGIVLRLEPSERRDACSAQGYRLRVAPDGVELVGRSPTGLFYALQTLRQMILFHGAEWPCGDIEDRPDFAVRGLSYDVSRGKVPQLAALRDLADRLSRLKANHLELYVEHTFAFQFNPNIGRGCSPLTPDEIRELDRYCADRRIELVPSLASCGHMAFILSLPEYRELAEVETSRTWEQMTWFDRVRGMTINPLDPRARQLLENMYAEYLPLFTAPYVNVCCDETYDLGRGRNAALAAERGIGQLYLDHLHWLQRLSARHGKRLMFWGDIVKKHPEVIERLPRDAIVLDWLYSPDDDFSSTGRFRQAGLTTFVCPACASWNRTINDLGIAELNIRRFAAAGRQYGADGLLNTDWGDEGNINLPAGGWHPIYVGAATAWNVDAPTAEDFDLAFSFHVFGDRDGATARVLRRAAAVLQMPRSWPMLYAPWADRLCPLDWTAPQLQAWREDALAGIDAFNALAQRTGPCAQDARELAMACRLNVLFTDKLLLINELNDGAKCADPVFADRLRRWSADCRETAAAYESVWLARNKPADLRRLLDVFDRLAAEAESLAVG